MAIVLMYFRTSFPPSNVCFEALTPLELDGQPTWNV